MKKMEIFGNFMCRPYTNGTSWAPSPTAHAVSLPLEGKGDRAAVDEVDDALAS